MADNSNPRDRLSLAQAVRGAQLAAADRNDFNADARAADLARIEMLAEDLQEVFEDVPVDDPQWQFAVSKGQQPRLWVDITAYVAMARDRRTYRFVRDTRHGRILVAESTDMRLVADAITNYIAERIVERQQMMEGSTTGLTGYKPVREAQQPSSPVEASAAPAAKQKTRLNSFITAAFWFLIGAAAGSGFLMVLFWDRFSRHFQF